MFVRHTLPGERVRARITEGGPASRFLRADAVEILLAAPERVPPPCPYAGPGRCGGCDWQHAALPAQRALKAAVLAEQLRRLAGLDWPVEVIEVPGAPGGLGWRTRVGFVARPDGVLGLRRHRSHDVEPVDRCRIAHPQVTAVGAERRRWPGTTAVEVIAGVGTGDRAVVVTPDRRGAPVAAPPLDAPAALLRRHPRAAGGRGRGPAAATAVRGRPGVRERAAGRSWRVSGGGFWQVHPAAADTLVDAVLQLLVPAAGESALDLYCGVGLFAGALAERVGPGGRVAAVEADPTAAADAAYNLRDLPQVRVECGRVEPVLRRLGLRRADLVVLDPPRAGAGAEVARSLAGIGARAIGYVACDPAALARDVAVFAASGYRLTGLRAFDLFPMTAHVEAVALLEPQPHPQPDPPAAPAGGSR